MAVNILLFDYELRQAGLNIDGVSSSPSMDFPDCRIDWPSGHPTPTELATAQGIYAIHDPNKLLPWEQVAKDSIINYGILPLWIKTGTVEQAETYINNQIFSGQTEEQVHAWIDSNVTGTTLATALANIRTALKITASAILSMRGLFILSVKLLIYIRDLIIRFRGNV